VRMTEGPAVPAECFDSERNGCIITPICKLRGVLAEAVRAFYAALDCYTLEDLVRNRHALAKVLLVEGSRVQAH
jgi:Rrf2 family nitric oxide-sensitive transcriptional repressor